MDDFLPTTPETFSKYRPQWDHGFSSLPSSSLQKSLCFLKCIIPSPIPYNPNPFPKLRFSAALRPAAMMDGLLLTLTMPDWNAILIRPIAACTQKAVLKTVDYFFQRFGWPYLKTTRPLGGLQLF